MTSGHTLTLPLEFMLDLVNLRAGIEGCEFAKSFIEAQNLNIANKPNTIQITINIGTRKFPNFVRILLA